MPPKAATKRATTPRASAPRKASAAGKATEKTPAKAAPKKTAVAASKPSANGTATTKKRKADDDVADAEDKENRPKIKKAKTTSAPTKKTSTKESATATTGASKTKAAPKQAAKKETTKDATAKMTAPKRKPADETDEEDVKAKKQKPAPKKAAAPKHPHKIGTSINTAPTEILDVYVFGEGSSGELGLGSKANNGKKPIDVKRPRLNPNLDAQAVGVVQVACGGMHAVALTKDSKILTWGVNDSGALGRDTTWDGGLRDMDGGSDAGSDSDSDDGDTDINPKESNPAQVQSQYFADGVKFVQVIASDSATFALTEDGRVYGWGTFRASDGVLGFSMKVHTQYTPAFVPELKKIKSLAAGANHILALDTNGRVWAWGCGQQNQLGRRIIERNNLSSLVPQGMGLPRKNFNKIACGQYHSFAVDDKGRVWTWGLNAFGGTGIREGAGEDEAVILRPELVESLAGYKIVDIDGGQHHSLACSDKGELLTWGRFDGYQVGLEESEVDGDKLIRDEANRPRILADPTVVPSPTDVVHVSAGTDNSFAVTSDGKAYSWGFNSNYQGGQGHYDDIKKPTHIDNTAVRGKQLVYAGAGGQYSIVCGKHGGEVDGN